MHTGQPRCPRGNSRPRKRACSTHTAVSPRARIAPSSSTHHPPGPTGKHAHNKRPDPTTPSGRTLGPHSAASSDNDKHLAQLLRPSSPSPLTRRPREWGPRSPDSPFSARWHQTKEAGASSPRATCTHRPRPRPGSSFRGTAGRAAAAEGAPARPPRPRSPGPRGCGRSRRCRAPGGASRPARPSAPFPGESKPRTGLRRDAAGGLCGRARGRLLVLSSRGWVRPDRGAVGRRRGRDWAAAAAGPRASGLQPLAEGRASAATHRNAALRTASLLPLSGGGRRQRRLRARSLL